MVYLLESDDFSLLKYFEGIVFVSGFMKCESYSSE